MQGMQAPACRPPFVHGVPGCSGSLSLHSFLLFSPPFLIKSHPACPHRHRQAWPHYQVPWRVVSASCCPLYAAASVSGVSRPHRVLPPGEPEGLVWLCLGSTAGPQQLPHHLSWLCLATQG